MKEIRGEKRKKKQRGRNLPKRGHYVGDQLDATEPSGKGRIKILPRNCSELQGAR